MGLSEQRGDAGSETGHICQQLAVQCINPGLLDCCALAESALNTVPRVQQLGWVHRKATDFRHLQPETARQEDRNYQCQGTQHPLWPVSLGAGQVTIHL